MNDTVEQKISEDEIKELNFFTEKIKSIMEVFTNKMKILESKKKSQFLNLNKEIDQEKINKIKNDLN
ncbi:MAG: hypothetical protein AAB477_01670 [Patescibacteria group bacterium]